MNRGTAQGDLYEIEFIRFFNTNKELFVDYFNELGASLSKHYLTRVTTKQFSKLSSKKVMTRADAYLIKIHDEVDLEGIDLNENVLEEMSIKYDKICNSGISIKISSSKYQILKLTPYSFYKLFNEYELGAGSSIYCDSVEDYYKNNQIIAGWHTNWPKLLDRFNLQGSSTNDSSVLKSIKVKSNAEIKRLIEDNEEIKEKIFNGIGLYEEPYTAHYFYKGNALEKLKFIPFIITTGSGRSKGNYTIVLKPI